MVAVVLVVVIGWLLSYLIRGKWRKDPLLKAYIKSCRKLARLGIYRSGQETPLQFSLRVQKLGCQQASVFIQITHLFIKGRYINDKSTSGKKIAKSIKKLSKQL